MRAPHHKEEATHCIVRHGLTEDHIPELGEHLDSCLARDIPVVEVSWLEEVSELGPEGRWYVPRTDRNPPALGKSAKSGFAWTVRVIGALFAAWVPRPSKPSLSPAHNNVDDRGRPARGSVKLPFH